ncbi:hypothetical protein DFR49_0945 [Hephaestia caeni]|uniref:Uncharacterized protein n=1 Tax=Hephaestia caeni TaxID=645617 RepID=A0A397PJT2_9SPHN|nr:hypothetical protein [Hephaestia caeni]RIA46404.1 hypothetical protein DFR49_0945 [Hephaestia caeni]
MSEAEILNWTALYAATGLTCLVAVLLSVTIITVQLWRERFWRDLGSVRAVMLFLPGTWWRWQKLYLTGTPVILAIVGLFAVSLEW